MAQPGRIWLATSLCWLAVGCNSYSRYNPKAFGAISVASGAGHVILTGSIVRDPGSQTTYAEENISPCRIVNLVGRSGMFTRADAGRLTVSGGVRSIVVDPSSVNGIYAYTDALGDLWNGGETIVVSTAGGSVPGFMTTIVAPSAIDITQPSPPPMDTPLVISRARDLDVRWTGGAHGEVSITLAYSDAPGSSTILTCEFDSAAGAGTVPKEALARLRDGAQGSLLFFAGPPFYSNLLNAGEFTVDVSIQSLASWAGGGAVSTFVAQD